MSDYETEATQVPIVPATATTQEQPKTSAPGKAPKRKQEKPAPYKGKEQKKPKEKKTKKVEVAATEEVVSEGTNAGTSDLGEHGLGGAYIYNDIEELLEDLENVPSRPCPIHKKELMELLHSQKEHVQDTFLRCNVEGCPAFCATDKYEEYYTRCDEQGHNWFTFERVAKMKCKCGYDPTLVVSKSVDNPGRMYLRCRDNLCDFFSWWDMKPYRPVQVIMLRKYDD